MLFLVFWLTDGSWKFYFLVWARIEAAGRSPHGHVRAPTSRTSHKVWGNYSRRLPVPRIIPSKFLSNLDHQYVYRPRWSPSPLLLFWLSSLLPLQLLPLSNLQRPYRQSMRRVPPLIVQQFQSSQILKRLMLFPVVRRLRIKVELFNHSLEGVRFVFPLLTR